jgi:hypothetical protein
MNKDDLLRLQKLRSKNKQMTPVTIDEAIYKLRELKKLSPLRGKTVLVLSLTGSGIEQVHIDNVVLMRDSEGAVVEVRARLPEGCEKEGKRR